MGVLPLARVGWGALMVACGVALVQVAGQAGGAAIAAGAAMAVLPDLALLYGIGPGLAKGQIAPRAVPFYNAVHLVWGPLAATGLGLLLGEPVLLAAGLGWALHVAMDRTAGYGLRTGAGFQRA
jgi:hypothetical protein